MEGLKPEILQEICSATMPFGKYKDTVIADLPISYLEWFHRQGMPPGKLGMQLSNWACSFQPFTKLKLMV